MPCWRLWQRAPRQRFVLYYERNIKIFLGALKSGV